MKPTTDEQAEQDRYNALSTDEKLVMEYPPGIWSQSRVEADRLEKARFDPDLDPEYTGTLGGDKNTGREADGKNVQGAVDSLKLMAAMKAREAVVAAEAAAAKKAPESLVSPEVRQLAEQYAEALERSKVTMSRDSGIAFVDIENPDDEILQALYDKFETKLAETWRNESDKPSPEVWQGVLGMMGIPKRLAGKMMGKTQKLVPSDGLTTDNEIRTYSASSDNENVVEVTWHKRRAGIAGGGKGDMKLASIRVLYVEGGAYDKKVPTKKLSDYQKHDRTATPMMHKKLRPLADYDGALDGMIEGPQAGSVPDETPPVSPDAVSVPEPLPSPSAPAVEAPVTAEPAPAETAPDAVAPTPAPLTPEAPKVETEVPSVKAGGEAQEASSAIEKPNFGRMEILSAVSTEGDPRKSRSQDAYIDKPETGLAAVLDGIGGHKNGGEAARIGADEFGRLLSGPLRPENAEDELLNAARSADERIRRETIALDGKPSGTTLAAMKLLEGGEQAGLVWSGDSRVMRMRDGKLEMLTLDDGVATSSNPDETPMEIQERMSSILSKKDRDDYELINSHATMNFVERNVVSRSLGGRTGLGAEQANVGIVDVQLGDRFILTSDGVHDNLTLSEMQEIVREAKTSQEASQLLLERAKARSSEPRGDGNILSKMDDITAVAMFLQEPGAAPKADGEESVKLPESDFASIAERMRESDKLKAEQIDTRGTPARVATPETSVQTVEGQGAQDLEVSELIDLVRQTHPDFDLPAHGHLTPTYVERLAHAAENPAKFEATRKLIRSRSAQEIRDKPIFNPARGEADESQASAEARIAGQEASLLEIVQRAEIRLEQKQRRQEQVKAERARIQAQADMDSSADKNIPVPPSYQDDIDAVRAANDRAASGNIVNYRRSTGPTNQVGTGESEDADIRLKYAPKAAEKVETARGSSAKKPERSRPPESSPVTMEDLSDQLRKAGTRKEIFEIARTAASQGFVAASSENTARLSPGQMVASVGSAKSDRFYDLLRKTDSDVSSYEALRRHLDKVATEPDSELERVKNAFAPKRAHEAEFEWTPETVEAVLASTRSRNLRDSLKLQLVAAGHLNVVNTQEGEHYDVEYAGQKVRLIAADEVGESALGKKNKPKTAKISPAAEAVDGSAGAVSVSAPAETADGAAIETEQAKGAKFRAEAVALRKVEDEAEYETARDAIIGEALNSGYVVKDVEASLGVRRSEDPESVALIHELREGRQEYIEAKEKREQQRRVKPSQSTAEPTPEIDSRGPIEVEAPSVSPELAAQLEVNNRREIVDELVAAVGQSDTDAQTRKQNIDYLVSEAIEAGALGAYSRPPGFRALPKNEESAAYAKEIREAYKNVDFGKPEETDNGAVEVPMPEMPAPEVAPEPDRDIAEFTIPDWAPVDDLEGKVGGKKGRGNKDGSPYRDQRRNSPRNGNGDDSKDGNE